MVGEVVNRASRHPVRGAAGRRDDLGRHAAARSRRVRRAPVPGLRLKGIDAPVDGYLVEGVRDRGFREGSSRGIEGVETRTVGRELEMRALQDHFGRWPRRASGRSSPSSATPASASRASCPTSPSGSTSSTSRCGGSAAGRRPPPPPCRSRCSTTCSPPASASAATTVPVEVRRKWERGLEQALGPGDETVRAGAHDRPVARLRDRRRRPRSPAPPTRRASAAGPRRTSASTSAGSPSGRRWSCCWRTCTGPTRRRSALIHAAEPVLRDSSVLVVATSRPTLLEQHPHWGEGLDYHTRISLRSLSRRETRRLLDEILKGADRVPEALGDLVVTTSEGNPFYVEELVNWFLESGVIRRDDDGLAGVRRPARDGRRAAHPAQRAASPPRRPVGGGAPGVATGIGDRPGVLGRRRALAGRRRPGAGRRRADRRRPRPAARPRPGPPA